MEIAAILSWGSSRTNVGSVVEWRGSCGHDDTWYIILRKPHAGNQFNTLTCVYLLKCLFCFDAKRNESRWILRITATPIIIIYPMNFRELQLIPTHIYIYIHEVSTAWANKQTWTSPIIVIRIIIHKFDGRILWQQRLYFIVWRCG